MKHYKFDDKAKYQEKLNTEEEETTDYFALMMKQKREERILAVIVFILAVLSLVGTGVGVYNLMKLDTILSYLFLAIIIIPLIFLLAELVFIALYKEEDPELRDETLNFISVSFLVFVFTGNCVSVFYLIKLGTVWAYFISILIICVVLYLVFKAVKSRMREKN